MAHVLRALRLALLRANSAIPRRCEVTSEVTAVQRVRLVAAAACIVCCRPEEAGRKGRLSEDLPLDLARTYKTQTGRRYGEGGIFTRSVLHRAAPQLRAFLTSRPACNAIFQPIAQTGSMLVTN